MRLFAIATLALMAVLANGGGPAPHSEAAWPGENGLIAYTETQTQDLGGIYTNNEAGTQEHPIAPAGSHFPSWSPDGQHLIYERNLVDIYIADSDGSNPTFTASGSTPSWHPDGERIVYSKNDDIYIADPPSETNLTNTPGLDERSPVVSPNGQQIAYFRQPFNSPPFDIWIMDINGGNPHPITAGDSNNFFDAPDWSPDGTQIVYQAFVDSGPDAGTDLWIMDANGGDKHNITNTPNRFEDEPAWSPDGERIAFLMNRSDNPSGGVAQPAGSPPSDIWTMNTSGGDLLNVTRGDGITGYDEPDWQPLALPDTSLWGDTDCDGDTDEHDALALLLSDAGVSLASPQGEDCPAIGAPVHTEAGDYPWGDWNCSGEVEPQDMVHILSHIAEVGSVVTGCLAIGTSITITNPLDGGVLATFDVVGETFHVWTAAPDTIQQLLDLEASTSTANIPSGTLLEGPGPGAFNAPYSWHMDPEQVTMAEATIEACDATPSYVEENPDQFFLVGYCPWSAELIDLADFR